MEYTKIKDINECISESVVPMDTPQQIFEMYSVPVYGTGHPEYLHGNEIASNKIRVKKNDVLLCKINPRINRVWIVADESEYPCIVIRQIKRCLIHHFIFGFSRVCAQ